MKLELLTQCDTFGKLRAEWEELQQRSATNTMFNTYQWVSIWWEVYRPGDLFVVTVRESGRLMGIAPWFIDESKVLRGIGCVDVTDYVDILVDRDCTGPVYECLAGFLDQHREKFESIQLCNIPATSPTYELFPEMLAANNMTPQSQVIDVCPVIALPAAWDVYLAQLSKKRRHEVRRKLRRIDGAGVEYEVYETQNPNELQEDLATFFDLMAESDPEKALFLQDERNVMFFQKIAHSALHNGWLRLMFLKIDGEATAAYLNFEYEDRILVYNSGLLIEPYGHLSPGIILLCHIIQYAIDRNLRVLDLLRGDEVYKYRMGAEDTHIYGISVD